MLAVVHVVGILLGGQVETADADVVGQKEHRWVSCAGDHAVNAAAAGVRKGTRSDLVECLVWTQVVDGLTLGGALCAVRLAKGAETLGAKALVASLCVLALLRTRAVHLALIHVCVFKCQR